jgi:quercetin dioxygenase-like cupin family protein
MVLSTLPFSGYSMAKTPTSEILKLNSMVDYQVDTIVSRQVMKTEAGNITLFSFDEGQELSEHTSTSGAFVYLLDGQSEITISGKSFHLQTGQGIILPANIPHAVKAISKLKMMLTILNG